MATLTPQEIRAELDVWLGSADHLDASSFARGQASFRLSDGREVTHDREPGYLVLDGERHYSAAWL